MSDQRDDVALALRDVRAHPDDEAAWRIVYSTYRRHVLGYLYMLGFTDPADREDLTSEVFFRFLSYSPWSRDWSTLPDPPVISAYLRATAQNVGYTALRNRDRRRHASDEAVSRLAQFHLIDFLGDDLSKAEKDFLVAYVGSGYSLTGLAASLGLTYSAVATRLHRIRKKIRASSRRLQK